jgi:hypothetical protein
MSHNVLKKNTKNRERTIILSTFSNIDVFYWVGLVGIVFTCLKIEVDWGKKS